MISSSTRSSYTHEWSEVEPKPSNVSTLINHIPPYVHAGYDLMIEVDGALHHCLVVVLENTYNPELLVNVWVFEPTISHNEGLATLNLIRYNNVCGMCHVMKLNWSVSAVQNFAYIFHSNTI